MRKLFTLVLAAVALAGCRSGQVPSETLRLRLAVNDIYCKDTACACVHHIAARTYGETQQRLLDEYNIDLQLDYFVEPYNLEKAILAGKHDGVICKPWIALMLEKQAGAGFERIADIVDPFGNRSLTGIVVVMADSEFLSLEDLQGKKMLIGEPDGYEKHYAAKQLFDEKGIEFQALDMRASCIENLGQLMEGSYDAVVVSDYALTADCAVDFAKPEDFRILGKTEKIPLTSVILDGNKVSSADQDRLEKALLGLSEKGAPESLLSKGFVKAVKWEPAELE